MFTINVKENNAVKKYICSSAKAVAAKMSELALWTKDVQISWGMMSTAPLTMPSDRFRPTIFWLLFD